MKPNRSALVDRLLRSEEPSIRWKMLVGVLDEDPHSKKTKEVRHLARRTLDTGSACRYRLSRGR